MKYLGQVDWARLFPAVQQMRDDIAAMTLPDTMHLVLMRPEVPHALLRARLAPGD
ncbi:hypothetical protein [uncultured Ruegeria sp.]|uniref:hypothetical protein n=1 Tax=uncultured Ruegeria sp. TaxID=259304 RepID=UPI00261C6621|nr:hypothetical protein [uncultured Ruegeria sp.]